MSKVHSLSLDVLRLDGGTQARLAVSEDTVDDYAEVLEQAEGDWPFAPIDVFHDGTDYFVADGFHRTLAAVRLKRASVPCHVHRGTAKDAKIFGMTANDRHGLRMSRADKRACVLWLLDQGVMKHTEIAKTAGVGVRTVVRIVSESKNTPMACQPSKTRQKPSKPDPVEEEVWPEDDTDDAADVPESPESEDPPFDAPVATDKEETPPAKPEKPEKPEKQVKGTPEQNLRNMFQQHIDKAVRIVDDLNELCRNPAAHQALIKLLQGIRLWKR